MHKKILPSLILGLLCAIGTHVVLFTDQGHRLQSAIVESDTTRPAEAELVYEKGLILVRGNIKATQVIHLTGEIHYDPESITLGEVQSGRGKVTTQKTVSGIRFELTFDQPETITLGHNLLSFPVTLQTGEEHAVNLSNVLLSMNDGTTHLSTAGTGEF